MAAMQGSRARESKTANSPLTPAFWATALYTLLLVAFWLGVRQSPLLENLGSKLPWAFASFAILLAPLWFFAFGASGWILSNISSPRILVVLPASLAIPYFVFSLPTGEFHWQFAVAMVIPSVVLAALLQFSNLPSTFAWQDAAVLAVIAATHILKLLSGVWSYSGLASLPKLYLIDLALYLYLVVRRLDGMGYSFIPARATFLIGLRELCFFMPLGLGLGFALRFIHFHQHAPSPLAALASIVLTFLLVAVPEEIFFRAILQNLLETRLGRQFAQLLASILFGLAHFNKGATFNWRYVLLAAIAGIFYGRAWRTRRQVLASATTHTLVDVIWSLWFR